VHVSIADLGRFAETDSGGRYQLDRLPGGTYRVSFRRIGFAPETRSVTVVASRAVLDLSLRESLIEIEPVQVTATADPTAMLVSPQPTEALGGVDLRVAQGASLGRTVEGMAGVWNQSTGTGIGKPVIRGLSSDRVLVVAGGQRLESLQVGDDDAPSLDTFDAHRIEVIRGPASVLYGSDAIGGVINVVPRELPTAFNRAPLLQGSIGGSFGSNGRDGEGSIMLEGAREGLGFRGSLLARGSGDIRTPTGPLDNSGVRTLTAAGALGARGVRGSIEARYSRRTERMQILPDPAGDPHATPLQRNAEDLAKLALMHPVGPARVELDLGYEQTRRREYERRNTPQDSVANGNLARNYSVAVRFHHAPLGSIHGLVGVTWLRHRIHGFGQSPQLPSMRSDDLGAYVFEQRESGPWSFSFGTRYDHRGLAVPADPAFRLPKQSRAYRAVTANAGLLRRLTEASSIVFNLGSGFRAPSGSELYSSGPDEGSQSFPEGNRDLRVERSLNADLALRVQSSRWRAEVGGYLNHIRDFIYSRPTGVVDGASRLPVFAMAQGNARLFGFEATSDLHVGSGLEIRTTIDYVRGDNTTNGHPLPGIPPLRASGELRFERDSKRTGARSYAEVGGEVDARQTRLDPADVATPGYFVAHFGAGCEFPVSGHQVTADLLVRNLLDRRYASFLSRYKTYALAPGRDVVLRVSIAL
jgi:iron complex outermembrane recepter protein